MTVEYYIGKFKKHKVCKDLAEAQRFINFLKNLYGLTGTVVPMAWHLRLTRWLPSKLLFNLTKG